ncbi:unnamed protein product [Nesidiocoris tenuis]|uniref:Secreted protein n=1 Tax=Nesidiocoris tenuis TaxID=355587 RepID=A0A6H5G622_9HEMI|nr:unnamed protein product [Nesidiocoris tenuis]
MSGFRPCYFASLLVLLQERLQWAEACREISAMNHFLNKCLCVRVSPYGTHTGPACVTLTRNIAEDRSLARSRRSKPPGHWSPTPSDATELIKIRTSSRVHTAIACDFTIFDNVYVYHVSKRVGRISTSTWLFWSIIFNKSQSLGSPALCNSTPKRPEPLKRNKDVLRRHKQETSTGPLSLENVQQRPQLRDLLTIRPFRRNSHSPKKPSGHLLIISTSALPTDPLQCLICCVAKPPRGHRENGKSKLKPI